MGWGVFGEMERHVQRPWDGKEGWTWWSEGWWSQETGAQRVAVMLGESESGKKAEPGSHIRLLTKELLEVTKRPSQGSSWSDVLFSKIPLAAVRRQQEWLSSKGYAFVVVQAWDDRDGGKDRQEDRFRKYTVGKMDRSWWLTGSGGRGSSYRWLPGGGW